MQCLKPMDFRKSGNPVIYAELIEKLPKILYLIRVLKQSAHS